MKANFEIVDNYAIRLEGRLVDLHNNFKFTGYHYFVDEKTLIFTWTKSEGEWVPKDEVNKVVLKHINISYVDLKFDKNGIGVVAQAESCLYDISYFPSVDRETFSELMIQAFPTENDDIIYTFESGHFFRIKCDSIFATLEN